MIFRKIVFFISETTPNSDDCWKVSGKFPNCVTNSAKKVTEPSFCENPPKIPKSPNTFKIPQSLLLGDKIPKVGHPVPLCLSLFNFWLNYY